MLKEIFLQPRFIAMVCGIIAGFAGKYGLQLDEASLALIMSPVVAFILGRSWSQKGAAAAAIEQETAIKVAAIHASSSPDVSKTATELIDEVK